MEADKLQAKISGAVDLESIFKNNLWLLYGEKTRTISPQQLDEMRILYYAGLGSMFVMLVPESLNKDDKWIEERAQSVEKQLQDYWGFMQEKRKKKIIEP